MDFTIEVRSGFCNVLKSLITALSISEMTNVLPNPNAWWPDGARWDMLLDNELICRNKHNMGESFISARFLILKNEELEQQHIKSDTNAWGSDLHEGINIVNPKLVKMFTNHMIDWSFDRNLISDNVFNRIQLGIKRVKWNSEIINEFNRMKSKLITNHGKLLTIQIRTWQSKDAGDRNDLLKYNDGVLRKYTFELYKNEIDKFLPKSSKIFLTIDREDLLPQYIEYLKYYDVVTYLKSDTNLSSLQHSAVTMLLGSLCDLLVCSRISTFGECIWWFGGCKAEVNCVG